MKSIVIATAIVLTNVLGTAAFATSRQIPNDQLDKTNGQTDNSSQQVKELSAGRAMPLLFQNGKATTVLFGYVQNAQKN